MHCSLITFFQVGVLEDTRNRTLHGILRVQSCFRGHQARRHLKQLGRGIATLQSCGFSLNFELFLLCFIWFHRVYDSTQFLHAFSVQLYVVRKLEKNMQSCYRDTEQLCVYKSR